MIRTLIVDDEPIARRGLQRLLAAEGDCEIVGEAGSGPAAIEAIANLRPELVLLDIQMPGMSGIDVVAAVGAHAMPAVIFVTAFDQYAIRAFDLSAVDYVLKPIDPERLARALVRARERLAIGSRTDVRHRLERVLDSLGQRRTDRLVVKSAGRIQFVPVDDIERVHAEDNYLRIHAGAATYLLRETVTGLEQRLDPSVFVRIRRSTIVRIDRIREIRPLLNGLFELTLADGTRVASSRRFRRRIEELVKS